MAVVFSCCILAGACDSFTDAKKLAEEVKYYKAQCEQLNQQLADANQKLGKAYEEIKQLNIDIDTLKAEVERSTKLHKEMFK